MADTKQNLLKYGEVIERCWEDEAYKKRFIEDPEEVLAEVGFVLEEGVTYKVIRQPKLVRYLVLPHEGSKGAVQLISRGLLNRAEQTNNVIPEGVEIRIIQNSDEVRHLILPASPKTLTKAQLEAVAGGGHVLVATDFIVGQTVAAISTEGVLVETTAAAIIEVGVGLVVAAVVAD